MRMMGGGGYRATCPACGSRMRITASREQSAVSRLLYAQCSNVGCGGTFSGVMEWAYALNTPGIEQPRVRLPLAPAVARRQALASSRERDASQIDMLDAADH